MALNLRHAESKEQMWLHRLAADLTRAGVDLAGPDEGGSIVISAAMKVMVEVMDRVVMTDADIEKALKQALAQMSAGVPYLIADMRKAQRERAVRRPSARQ